MSGPLTPEDRQRLVTLFDRAADLPATEHAAFVERECGSNPALRAELVRLLEDLSAEDVLGDLQPGAELSPGTRIGPYRLLEKLGEGGMGEVYAAEQLEPVSRRVALKVIKRGMDTAQVVVRFEAEQQALARMSHPNVAHVLDGGVTPDGRPYFAMEYVAGEPITDYCDRHKLTTRERVELVVAVCEGLQHAHQKGVIHRDLKPSNLLVKQQDGRAVPKVIDFGVARATSGRLTDRTLRTVVGQIVGTLDYMSPEQADPGGVDLDTRSDLYSLGVVLYQLVSGLLPFEHDSAGGVPLSEVQRAIRETDPPTPSTRLRRQTDTATAIATKRGTDDRSLIRQLSGDLDWICLKALEKDPARRYPSMSELAADLRRHLADEPVLAGRPGASYRARKFVRRHQVGVTAGALVVAALAVGGYGLVTGRLEAEARAAENIRLADRLRLVHIDDEAALLWPPHPDAIPGLLALRRFVESDRATRAAAGDFPYIEEEEPALDRMAPPPDLEQLRLELIETDEPTAAFGWSVAKRLAFARRLEQGFAPGGEYARRWDEALPEIRKAYPRLPDLSMQMGLVPLWQDEASGQWEFAHLMTGEEPRRENGKVVMTAETGLVLVLLEGGDDVAIGSQGKHSSEAYYYKDSVRGECVVLPDGRHVPHTVRVEPFFLSKFEMTVDQWSGVEVPRRLVLRREKYPILNVTWLECDRVMRRLGLALPTEEQWEYAARAGTSSPWWTGDDVSSLEGAENLLDQAAVTGPRPVPPTYRLGEPVPWNDGVVEFGPVGAFRPNPFGFYDILGNLSEWTCSHRKRYGKEPGPIARGQYLARGGNGRTGPHQSRASFRSLQNGPGFSNPALGVRPARRVERSAPR